MNFNDLLLGFFLIFVLFSLVNRVGYSNGILQIDGGSSSSNGAKTSSGSSQILRVSPQTLVYLELSPDFCRANVTAGKFNFRNSNKFVSFINGGLFFLRNERHERADMLTRQR